MFFTILWACSALPWGSKVSVSDSGSLDEDTASSSVEDDTNVGETLPGLLESLEGGCTEFDTPGAMTYFWGEVSIAADGAVDGIEKAIYIANDNWIALGETGCEIVWAVSGEVVAPGSCAQCDQGLTLQALLDQGASNCPEELMEGFEVMEEGYDLLHHEDGTVDWFFSASGNPLGSGFHNSSSKNYLSNGVCSWF